MIVSEKYKLVFIGIPKTGTRTIRKVLLEKFDGITVGMHNNHDLHIPSQYKDYFSFAVVRNPYDRAVSLWWSTCIREQNNNGTHFLRNVKSKKIEDLFAWMINEKSKGAKMHPLQLTQSDYIVKNNFNKILSFEKLEKDFNEFPFITSYIELPKLNASNKIWGDNKIPKTKNYQSYLNQKAIDYINMYYAEDFRLLTQYEKI